MAGQSAGTPPCSAHEAGTGRDSQDLFNLLRYTHVFSSVVQEILEVKLLREATSDPLSLSQFHLLKLIALNGHHQVGQVADFLGVSAPAASKNIDKLERLGLVSREQSKGDRRAILLASSPKGRSLVERYEGLKAERVLPVLQEFTVEELRQLTRYLERFALALIDTDEAGGDLCFRCSAYFDETCPVAERHSECPYQRIRSAGTDRTMEKEV